MTPTILFVDDDIYYRRPISDYLAKHGFSIIEAEDGTEALAALTAEKIDLVLTNLIMPGIDGIQLTGEIKRRKPKVPVVILTKRPMHKQEAIAAGADKYLLKDISPRNLVTQIQLLFTGNNKNDMIPSIKDPSNEELKNLVRKKLQRKGWQHITTRVHDTQVHCIVGTGGRAKRIIVYYDRQRNIFWYYDSEGNEVQL